METLNLLRKVTEEVCFRSNLAVWTPCGRKVTQTARQGNGEMARKQRS